LIAFRIDTDYSAFADILPSPMGDCAVPPMAMRSFSSSDIAALPPEYFYPVNWSNEAGQCIGQRVIEQGRLLTEQEKHDLFSNAYAVTYWAHTW
jgi:hypothetical protein